MGISKTLIQIALGAAFVAVSSNDAANSHGKDHGLIVYTGKKSYDHNTVAIVNIYSKLRR